MRSRAERLETLLRSIAFAALAGLLGLLLWSRPGSAPAVHLQLQVAFTPLQRDSLAAVRHAGTEVTWSGPVPAVALAAEPAPGPAGGAFVRVAAPAGARVAVNDTLGALDSARASSGGATFVVRSSVGLLTAAALGQRATARPPDRPPARPVAVLASAGWESKFLAAALEERGWQVDVRLGVAPGRFVTQGAPWPLDTARQAAVVVLDSLAPSDAAAVARFARQGGGVILGPGALGSRALAGLAPARAGAAVRAAALSFAGGDPLRALSFLRLRPDSGALALAPAVAVRRAGAGRVAAVGYQDTWRWRMTGGPDAVEEHAAWWSALVASVSYRPSARPPVRPSDLSVSDPSPLASLVFALGPATPAPRATKPAGAERFLPLLFGLALACLLAEWTSRRLRGAA